MVSRYHSRAYGKGYDPLKLAGKCADDDRHCRKWAAAGDCETRASELVGLHGKCRKACGDCVQVR
jgi:prolyl 4-hydroxylase